MSVSIFVTYDGNCREAVTFYAGVFGLPAPELMVYGDAPENPQWPVAEADRNRIMYTSLNITGDVVMFCDAPAGTGVVLGSNIQITVDFREEDELRRIFAALSVGGSVDMPLQKTFFSKCYGMLTDKFGVPWQLMIEEPMDR